MSGTAALDPTPPPAGPPVGPTVPPWLDRLAAVGWRVLVVVALGLVLAGIAIELTTVTASILVALIIAALLVPTTRRLRAAGRSPTVAAGIASGLGLVALIAAVVVLALALLPYLADIIRAVEAGIDDIREQLVAISAPSVAIDVVDRVGDALLGALAIDPLRLAGPAIAVGTVSILGGFLTFFLLQDGDKGWAWLMRSMRPEHAVAVTESARQGLARVSGYLRRTILFAIADSLVTAVVLAALGVPLAGALAVLAFVGGFIPYLGAIATAAVVGLVALAFAGPPALVAYLVAIVATSVLTGRGLARLGLGAGVDVHPLLVLIAIPAGAALFGVLGVIALLPVTVFLLAVSRSVRAVLELEPHSAGSGPVAAGGIRVGVAPRQASAAAAAGVPVWLDRLAAWSWRGLVVVGLLWLAIQASIRLPVVVLPVVLAIVLAATLVPIVSRLRARGWSRWMAAAGATVGSSVLVVAVLLVSIVWTVGPLRDILETALDGAEALDLAGLVALVEDLGDEIIADIAGLLRAILGLGLTITLALLLTYFFLRDGSGLWRLAMGRLQGVRRDRLDAVGRSAVDVLGGYMIGTSLIALFGAVTSALIMVVLGLPLAVPIGILTFFGGFIPYIGSFVTTALAALIAVAVGTTTDVVIMAIFTVVFNIVQGNFVTPLVYGRTLSLHPAVILLAIPAGNEVAGILGMFLVVPFVAIVAATWRALLEAIAAPPTEPTAAPTAEPTSAGPDLPDVVDDGEEGDAGQRRDDDERQVGDQQDDRPDDREGDRQA